MKINIDITYTQSGTNYYNQLTKRINSIEVNEDFTTEITIVKDINLYNVLLIIHSQGINNDPQVKQDIINALGENNLKGVIYLIPEEEEPVQIMDKPPIIRRNQKNNVFDKSDYIFQVNFNDFLSDPTYHLNMALDKRQECIDDEAYDLVTNLEEE